MSITEIACTGLLRVAAVPHEEAPSADLPEWTSRAVALASLQGCVGVPSAMVDLPSRAVPPAVRRRKPQPRRQNEKDSGDYSARAKGRHRRATTDEDAPGTFCSLI